MAKRRIYQRRKTRKLRGISRIDSGSTHGWFVRRYKAGKTFSRLFSDRKLGGKGKAKSAALSYRDELETQLGYHN